MTTKTTKNSNLTRAKREKNDEFYTQLSDVEAELRHYREHFEGKTVYCNCDDPFQSAFFKHFALNFNVLGLKLLMTTSFTPEGAKLYRLYEMKDVTGDERVDLYDALELTKVDDLEGDGDFRSPECLEILDMADIVVTNPPFSLFREYVAQLVEHDKKFLIIGNLNAITYKEIFPLIKEGKMWLGPSISSGDRKFHVPDDYVIRTTNSGTDPDGRKWVRVAGVRWYTNLSHAKRNRPLDLFRSYYDDPSKYPKYDNYDAIEVSRVVNIPEDYFGVMGVPITFLDKHCPAQFEILGLTTGRDEFGIGPSKRYRNPIQVSSDRSKSNGSKANTRATLLHSGKPSGIYYTADNADGYLCIVYARILIQRKDQP